MSKYVIIHGQLREISDDELMHWKYVERKKLPNGKWRYYYNTYDNSNSKSVLDNYIAEQKKNANTPVKSDDTEQPKTKMSSTEQLLRSIETAKTWLNSRLDRSVIGTITGTAPKPLTWKQATELVSKKKMKTITVNGKKQYYFIPSLSLK